MSITKDGSEQYKVFAGKKYVLVATRTTKERAEALKERLTRIGTLSVRITKYDPKVVSVSPYYLLWARPASGITMTLDRVPAAAMRLI
jgi:hypothetical protein